MSTPLTKGRDSWNGQAERWIGLANVRPKPGNDALEGDLGAYVISIAWAEGPDDYAHKVAATLDADGFYVIKIEDVERFQERVQKTPPAPEIMELAGEVSPVNPVALATFHSYAADF